MSPATSVEEAWRSHAKDLRRALVGMTGSAEEAEDLVAETFARALVAWRTTPPADPAAWLYRVAVNLSRSRWRRVRTAVRYQSTQPPVAPTPAAGPDRVAVWMALKTLPYAQREALALHYLVDLSVVEIATLIGKPTGTVKARLARGRAALEGPLADEDHTQPSKTIKTEEQGHVRR